MSAENVGHVSASAPHGLSLLASNVGRQSQAVWCGRYLIMYTVKLKAVCCRTVNKENI